MSAAVEKLTGLSRKITITVPAEKVENAYTAKLNEVAKTIKMSGFRPGKVPVNVVEKRYGKGIRQDVAGELMQSSFEEAVKEHDLKIAGTPTIEPFTVDKGQPLEYSAVFETYPEIELKDLTGETIEKLAAEVTDADIERMLNEVKKDHADWSDVDRAATDGDRVVIDFKGMIDDEPFAGGEAKDFQLVLGSKQMIPGFEEGLLGCKAGEQKDLPITFPEDYGAKDLAGKAAVFKITVNKVQQAQMPELTDEFAKKIGVDGGVDKLKADVENSMRRELNNRLQRKLKETVLDKLLELNPIELPQALIDAEIKSLQDMTRQQMAAQQRGKKMPDIDLPRDPYVKEAEKRVRLGLLLAEVIKQYNIKVDKDKVDSKINEIAAAYQKPEEVVAWYQQNKQLLSEIEAAVEDDAIEKLLDKAQLNTKKVDYQEVMNSPS